MPRQTKSSRKVLALGGKCRRDRDKMRSQVELETNEYVSSTCMRKKLERKARGRCDESAGRP